MFDQIILIITIKITVILYTYSRLLEYIIDTTAIQLEIQKNESEKLHSS